jgi:hypothetical protein
LPRSPSSAFSSAFPRQRGGRRGLVRRPGPGTCGRWPTPPGWFAVQRRVRSAEQRAGESSTSFCYGGFAGKQPVGGNRCGITATMGGDGVRVSVMMAESVRATARIPYSGRLFFAAASARIWLVLQHSERDPILIPKDSLITFPHRVGALSALVL